MPNFIFANNVSTTLAGPVSSSAGTITLSSTANLPASIPSGYVLVITLNDVATKQNFEVLYATAITGATLTVERAQEGTAALTWLANDFAYSAPTKGQQQSFGQVGATNTWAGANTFTDPVVIPNAATSTEAIPLGQAESLFALLAGSATQTFSVAPGTTANEAVQLAQFPSTLSTNGVKKFPDPNSPSGFFIIQFGEVNVPPNATTFVTFPIAFPNAALFPIVSLGASITSGQTYTVGADLDGVFGISVTLVTTSTNPLGIRWMAFGY